MGEDCKFCKLSNEVEEYLEKFFKKVPEEDKPAIAGFIMEQVTLEGSCNYMEALGIFEIAKDEFKKSYKEVNDEDADRENILRMN